MQKKAKLAKATTGDAAQENVGIAPAVIRLPTESNAENVPDNKTCIPATPREGITIDREPAGESTDNSSQGNISKLSKKKRRLPIIITIIVDLVIAGATSTQVENYNRTKEETARKANALPLREMCALGVGLLLAELGLE